MNAFQQLLNKVTGFVPALQEYGNALVSPFMGSDAQPFGSSGFYGQNPDGTNRSMEDALNKIVDTEARKRAIIEELRRQNRGF
jgi:hypothetical protein